MDRLRIEYCPKTYYQTRTGPNKRVESMSKIYKLVSIDIPKSYHIKCCLKCGIVQKTINRKAIYMCSRVLRKEYQIGPTSYYYSQISLITTQFTILVPFFQYFGNWDDFAQIRYYYYYIIIINGSMACLSRRNFHYYKFLRDNQVSEPVCLFFIFPLWRLSLCILYNNNHNG